jgi:hypothetical protein
MANLLMLGGLLARQNDVIKGELEKVLPGISILRKRAFVRVKKF